MVKIWILDGMIEIMVELKGRKTVRRLRKTRKTVSLARKRMWSRVGKTVRMVRKTRETWRKKKRRRTRLIKQSWELEKKMRSLKKITILRKRLRRGE